MWPLLRMSEKYAPSDAPYPGSSPRWAGRSILPFSPGQNWKVSAVLFHALFQSGSLAPLCPASPVLRKKTHGTFRPPDRNESAFASRLITPKLRFGGAGRSSCGLDPVNLSSSAVREGRGEETVDADSLAR